MREFIVSEKYYQSVRYMEAVNELIRCADCRYYCPIRRGSLLEKIEDEHEGICRHPDGCIGTDPVGFCHYALRREDNA